MPLADRAQRVDEREAPHQSIPAGVGPMILTLPSSTREPKTGRHSSIGLPSAVGQSR